MPSRNFWKRAFFYVAVLSGIAGLVVLMCIADPDPAHSLGSPKSPAAAAPKGTGK